MDMMVFTQAIISVFIALLLGLFMVQFTFKLFHRVTKNLNEVEELKNNNISVAILNGSFILSMAVLVKSTILPVTQTLFTSIFHHKLDFLNFITNLGLICAQFFSTLFLGSVLLYGGIWIFSKLNRSIDELAEIKNGNVAVSIIVAIICISLALVMQDALAQFVEVLIPITELKNITVTSLG